MQLYFIRHGQSTNNALTDNIEEIGSRNRSEDPDLTDIGLQQAECTAEALAYQNKDYEILHSPYGSIDFQNRQNFGLTHLYSSFMLRAVRTGSVISKRLGIPLYGHTDMHECGGIYLSKEVNGVKTVEILHGKGRAWFAENYPDLRFVQPIEDKGWWRGGKEDYAPRMERAFRVIQFLKDRHMGTNDRVGVITHGSFFALVLFAMLRLDLGILRSSDRGYRFVFNNCGITRIDYDDPTYFRLIYLNRSSHLPDHLIT